MFYRFTSSGARVAIDLNGAWRGQTLFLLGGGPHLAQVDPELLRTDGVVTMGLNNVPCTFKPNLWVGADRPPCFSPHIFQAPEIMKFMMINRRNCEVLGQRVRDYPSMFFFGAHEGFTAETFLKPHHDIVWWRSVFPMALQLAWRLGFRRVYLVGCGFRMSNDKQYAWRTTLTDGQVQYSQNNYTTDVNRLRVLKPIFDRNGFEVLSATPDSAANDILSYVSLKQAVASAQVRQDISNLVHSSALKKL